LLSVQQSLGRSSHADKQSSPDSSPDANDEQWLSQVCTGQLYCGCEFIVIFVHTAAPPFFIPLLSETEFY